MGLGDLEDGRYLRARDVEGATSDEGRQYIFGHAFDEAAEAG